MNELVRIKIDGKEVTVKENTPVIVAARNEGRNIPSMCYLQGREHITSCMVCMVKDAKTGKLFPSCSVKIEEGMEILTMDDEIHDARKMALELLLSEHLGDCEAPCQVTCPAHMNIPLMNRLLAKGNFKEALRVVKKDIALPAVFGRICPAPCEGACHRKNVDDSVSICLLKRFAGDHDLLSRDSWKPEIKKQKGKKVAIIGAGSSGLAAAWYLQIRGYNCEVFERHEKAGGRLIEEVMSKGFEQQILEKEISVIESLGVTFNLNTNVDALKFQEIRNSYDAVVISTGQNLDGVKDWGLEMHERGIVANSKTYQVGDTSTFVTGNALKPSKMLIRTLGQGKEAAFSVDQYLNGEKVIAEVFLFNSRFGKLLDDEKLEYLKESVDNPRFEPGDLKKGLSEKEVMEEASRCMHCDCRDMETCKLRIYSENYKAQQRRFKPEQRQKIVKHFQHHSVIYEPGKCIKCGICVTLCAENQEELGLTHIGRGFEMEIGVPFQHDLDKALKDLALEVVEKCPTGALAWKSKPH